MSFYLALHTGVNYTADAYDEAAGAMLNLLSTILSDRAALSTLTHGAPLTSAKSEIEVAIEEGELVAKAVLDLECPEKAKLDKAKFTKMVKGHVDADRWPAMKIVKKAVAPESVVLPVD